MRGGEVVVLAVELPAVLGEHRDDGLHRLLPALALVAHADVEGMELGRACCLAQAEFDPAARQQVERRHPLGDPVGLVGRELDDAVAEADLRVRWLAAPRNTSGAEECEYSSRK